RSEEHTSELQSHHDLVCRLLLEKKKRPPRDSRVVPRLVGAATHGRASAVSTDGGKDRPHASPRTLAIMSLTYSFFFNDTATTEIYTLSLHDALPIYSQAAGAPLGLALSPSGPLPRC